MSRHAVAAYMTASPHSIGRDQTLETAHEMMRRYRVRHLPVLEHGKLAGILSQRDLYLIESLPGVTTRDTLVDEAMSEDAYCVRQDARVEDVVQEMAENKYGCAVVMSGGRVCGIFTTTDALQALSGVLRSHSLEVPKAREATTHARVRREAR
ncbi:CBS domain-containing protein [Pendulispora brunnea]|uniref:CBS domain-containing protein n=1 Tax=Pendulispora brunnea TaxID=2905690 RepID=A0ABZ2JZH9_9BACT